MLKFIVVFVTMLASSSLFADAVSFWSRTDECGGDADGIVLINADSSGVLQCFSLTGSSVKVWSIKTGNTCVNIDDIRCEPVKVSR